MVPVASFVAGLPVITHAAKPTLIKAVQPKIELTKKTDFLLFFIKNFPLDFVEIII